MAKRSATKARKGKTERARQPTGVRSKRSSRSAPSSRARGPHPTARLPGEIKPLPQLRHLDSIRAPGERVQESITAGRRLREFLLARPQALYYRTVGLVRVPYPVKYGLLNATWRPSPFMHILNRLFVVRYRAGGRVRTLLFSPSDVEANKETPFFKRLGERFGPLQPIGEKLIAPRLSSVEGALAEVGIEPEEVDYISYDHLHTQDLRRWLGSQDQPGYFPNAKLLVMRAEWETVHSLSAPQRDWYCPRGIEGVPGERVVLLDDSVLLGEGVALVRTPGHTLGNHSLVVHTPLGLLVSSENGVSADSYAPHQSRIPGLRKYAEQTGMEIVLNGNTLEAGLTQYASMILEREIAGPCPKNPSFYNVVPSSELTSYWAFPGLKPTFSFGPLEFGHISDGVVGARA